MTIHKVFPVDISENISDFLIGDLDHHKKYFKNYVEPMLGIYFLFFEINPQFKDTNGYKILTTRYKILGNNRFNYCYEFKDKLYFFI